MVKPTLYRIPVFDALTGASVYYNYTGYEQSMVNNLVITEVDSGEIVYSFEYSSFEKVHHIPPSVLTNGLKYKAKIRVKLVSGTYTDFSDEVPFRVFETPVLDIDSIDGEGYVYNQDITFLATYEQSDGEPVKTYRFKLYDQSNELLKAFQLRRAEPSQSILSETVEGLEKNKGYYIECEIETLNGMLYSHKERFVPLYIVPSANGVIHTMTDSENGFVKVSSSIKQLIGTKVKGDATNNMATEGNRKDDYIYIDGDWVVIPEGNPVSFKGMDMNRASDFVMKVWCRNIPNDKEFMTMLPSDEDDQHIDMRFIKKSDRVIVEKSYRGVTSRHTSNKINIPSNTDFMVYFKVIEHRIDVVVKMI